MKKISSLLIVFLAATSALFAQTKFTYCDSVFVEFGTTVSGTTVKFVPKITTNTKTNPTVISQEWSFGNGAGANTYDAYYDYGKAGTFQPCLIVKIKNPRDPNTPCIKKYCGSVTTTSTDPCAKFAPDFTYTIGNDGVVTFEASASGTSTAFTYKWNFGDNTTGTNRKDTNTYKPGTYKACVTIYDPVTKCTKTVCKEFTIKDPCTNFNPSVSVTVNNDGTITFEAGTGTNYTYKWNFGDGTSGTDRTGKHSYKPGTYKPCVTIYDPATKCSKTICKEVTIAGEDPCKNFNPTAEFSISNSGLLTFAAQKDSNFSYFWNFADGTSSNDRIGTHQFKAGTYNVCLKIYNNVTKCYKIICETFTIGGEDPCKNFNPSFNFRVDGTIVIFEAQSGDKYTYSWTFYNSSTNGSQDRVVKIDYKKPGTYKACVLITDTKTGCKKTVCKEVVIKAKETDDPCKNFNPSIGFQIQGGKVNFTADGGKGAEFEWNFGNGKTSTDRSPSHTYTKSGKYNICVTVYDAKRKCKKTICFTIEVTVKNSDPCANFKPDFGFTTNGNKVVVEATNLTGVQYTWAWGDKQTGSGRVADHAYKVNGTYTCLLYTSPSPRD